MKKKIAKIVVVIVLIIIIVYTFSGSVDELVEQFRETSAMILLLIAAASVVYHLFEGWIMYSLAKRYNPDFRFWAGVQCAFYCSFYRLSTLGGAQAVAGIMFLGKHGVNYSEATGLYTIQYMVHRVSIALFTTIFFLLNWGLMSVTYQKYAGYLILAYVLTVLISIGLVLVVAFPKLHLLIIWLTKKLNKNGRFDSLLARMNEMVQVLEKSSQALIKDAKTMAILIIKNLIKVGFWYCIPYLVVYKGGMLSLMDSLSVTSLSVMTAAVIPTPAGIGASELVMTAMFSPLIGHGRAAAVTLLYRVATFIFPFMVGGVMILITRFAGKGKAKERK